MLQNLRTSVVWGQFYFDVRNEDDMDRLMDFFDHAREERNNRARHFLIERTGHHEDNVPEYRAVMEFPSTGEKFEFERGYLLDRYKTLDIDGLEIELSADEHWLLRDKKLDEPIPADGTILSIHLVYVSDSDELFRPDRDYIVSVEFDYLGILSAAARSKRLLDCSFSELFFKWTKDNYALHNQKSLKEVG